MFFKKAGQRTLYSMIVALLALALATPALAAFGPGDYLPAKRVLGQPNFTSNAVATTRKGMFSPDGVAVDPSSHKVFVADGANNRVLRFKSLYSLTNGAAAEAVLGQKTFSTLAAATTRRGMSQPAGLSVDAAGRLWVADSVNNRVLRFDHAATLGNGAMASAVLGQPNFTSAAPAATRSGMYSPTGVFTDAAGRLWVADTGNHRVLRFNHAASKASGANADGVLGQPDYTSNGFATAANRMWNPYSLTVDGAGRLWVADSGSNRVLRFDHAAAKANGANADGVLGQIDFTSSGSATSQSGMSFPYGVTTDPSGHLYVGELGNSRILIYNAAAGLPDGANAGFALGQPTFASATPNINGISAKSLYSPIGMFYDPHAKVLFVADTYNNRVLMYGKPSP